MPEIWSGVIPSTTFTTKPSSRRALPRPALPRKSPLRQQRRFPHSHGWLPLEHRIDECEELGSRRISGHSEVTIKLDVIGSRGPEHLRLDARFTELAPKPVRLGGGIGVVGNVQNQEGWDKFIPPDVPDGGEVALLRISNSAAASDCAVSTACTPACHT